MKKLNLFRVFDWEGFSMDKTFVCAGAKYSERKQMIVVEIAIIADRTDYGDPAISNVFEKFNVSIPGTAQDDLNKYVAFINHKCMIDNVQKASVYGEFQNNLSLVAQVQMIEE